MRVLQPFSESSKTDSGLANLDTRRKCGDCIENKRRSSKLGGNATQDPATPNVEIDRIAWQRKQPTTTTTITITIILHTWHTWNTLMVQVPDSRRPQERVKKDTVSTLSPSALGWMWLSSHVCFRRSSHLPSNTTSQPNTTNPASLSTMFSLLSFLTNQARTLLLAFVFQGIEVWMCYLYLNF